MRVAGWLALGTGAGLGVLAACFTAPDLTGPYLCSQRQECSDSTLSCVDGVCCKEDGGEPACPPFVVPDGGPPDAGCTIPSPPDCTVPSKLGACANGLYSCDGGTRSCEQVNSPVTESCNNLDDDCDGTVDNYPCGGPPSFLTPNATEYVSGVVDANRDVFGTPQGCLVNLGIPLDAGYLDAGNWRAVGVITHVLYGEKADGGFWDLSRPGQLLHFTFAGTMSGANLPDLFAPYPEPIVTLCGEFGGWQRYIPQIITAVLVEQGSNFSVDTSIDLGGTGTWIRAASGSGFNLGAIRRVELLLTPRNPMDGGNPAFDAGITSFGFFRP
jgi:hypothetical protein